MTSVPLAETSPREGRYVPRCADQTPLYRAFAEQLETFLARPRTDGHALPRFVVRELRALLDCGILAHGPAAQTAAPRFRTRPPGPAATKALLPG